MRAAGRAAKTCGYALREVDFLTAAAVFGWLVGVVAFVLLFPLWVTVDLAAVALSAGIVWRSASRLQAAFYALGSIAALVVATYLVSQAMSSGSSSTRGVNAG